MALPYFIATRNIDEAAIPMKAAEMKQFWYPRVLNHGVILLFVSAVSQTFQDMNEEKRLTHN